jgi:predicted nuclease of predicted toxin-antitoxin system
MKFLIDECLHTSLVQVANAEGHEAYHVVHIGMAGAKDWQIIQTIVAEDYTFVNNNASDFRALYQAEDLHAGLVIVVPQVRPAIQRQLFQSALEELGADELINEVLEVDLDDGVALFQRYPMRQD